MKIYLLIALSALLLAGCTQPEEKSAAKSYLCDDGKTIVAALSECPQLDSEYETCNKMAAAGTSYDESPRDQCFYSLAISRLNVSLCNKILSSDSYDSYNRAACGAKLALLTSDLGVCNKLLTGIDSSDCYSTYAKDQDDYTICERITDSDGRDECLNQFTGYYSAPSSWAICDKFTAKDYRDSCLYSAAEDTGDISYCGKLSNASYSYGKPECYAKVGLYRGDPSVCASLVSADDKDDCYYAYATSYPYTMSVCNQIKNSYRKSSCISYTNYSSSYYY